MLQLCAGLLPLLSAGLLPLHGVLAPSDEHLIASLPGFEGALPVRHFSGLEHVASADGFEDSVQIHYWLAESARNASEDPLIVWFQGGPGGSSLNGAFTEMGPLSLDGRSLATAAFNRTGVPTPLPNPFAWNAFASFVSVEVPAGVGFSFCDGATRAARKRCATWHDAKNNAYIFAWLQRFYARYPAMRARPLFIAGESYAGIVITLLAERIVASNANASTAPGQRVNLGGVLHGNGAVGHHCGGPFNWPDGMNTNDLPDDARHHVDFFFRAGLFSQERYDDAQRRCDDMCAPSADCQAALREVWREVGMVDHKDDDDFSGPTARYNGYNIYDTCPPAVDDDGAAAAAAGGAPPRPRRVRRHARHPRPLPPAFGRQQGVPAALPDAGGASARPLAPVSASRAFGGGTVLDGVEFETTWACGGNAVTEQYLNRADVRAAIHVDPAVPEHWRANVDLDYKCSNDDVVAMLANFSYCEARYGARTDLRPVLKGLVDSGVSILVYSGDVDGQLPHTGTEAWTSGLGLAKVRSWRPWVDGPFDQVQGYSVRYEGNFTFCTVKGAGACARTAGLTMRRCASFVSPRPRDRHPPLRARLLPQVTWCLRFGRRPRKLWSGALSLVGACESVSVSHGQVFHNSKVQVQAVQQRSDVALCPISYKLRFELSYLYFKMHPL